MIAQRMGWVVGPAVALALALGPNVASADIGGTVQVLTPGVNIVQGVEVAGVSTGLNLSGQLLTCIYTDDNGSPQTCLMPAGQTAPAPVVAAPAANDGPVQVAGVAVSQAGVAFSTCIFAIDANGPQTCAINSL